MRSFDFKFFEEFKNKPQQRKQEGFSQTIISTKSYKVINKINF